MQGIPSLLLPPTRFFSEVKIAGQLNFFLAANSAEVLNESGHGNDTETCPHLFAGDFGRLGLIREDRLPVLGMLSLNAVTP